MLYLMYMGFLKSIVQWVGIVLTTVFVVYIFHKQPCSEPVYYQIGTLDERFNVTKETVRNALLQAEEVWEKALNKNLFQYDEIQGIPVNFVYDTRQQVTDRHEELVTVIQTTEGRLRGIKQEIEVLKNKYKQDPSDRILVDTLNDHIRTHNALIRDIQSLVKEVNMSSDKKFEQGEYIYDKQGERINVFEYKSEAELVRLLAHEMGHVLGIDHNMNPESIMYYMNGGKGLSLTAEDMNDLRVVCPVSNKKMNWW